MKQDLSVSRIPVSAVVLTYNEEKNIEACLQSVAGWCDEIHVVDSGSTDNTAPLCRKYTNLIYVHPYVDHSSQWHWVLENVPLAHEWLLLLDADFILTEKLRSQIAQVVQKSLDGINGYYVIHRYVFRGQPIRFGGSPKKWWLRLVRHRNTRLDQSELVDFRLIIEGRTGKLSGVVYEDNKNEHNIDFWIDKHQKFSTRMAAEEVLRRAGKVSWDLQPAFSGNPDESILWFKQRWYFMPLYVRPFLYFIYRYFFRLGFLDGWNGFLFHFLQGFWFRLIVDIKTAELRKKIENGELTVEQLQTAFGHW